MPTKFKMNPDSYLCFYITNVCNLTCETCITYNNFRFKGHFKYKDFQDKCEAWANLVEPPRICILGGEPYANPDLMNWVTGLRSCWPNLVDFCVCTNGTYLQNIELSKEIINQKLWIDVSLHDPAHYDVAKKHVETIISSYNNYTADITIGTNITNATYEEENYYIDGRLAIKLSKVYEFGTHSTKIIHNNMIYMHKSNPVTAHNNCKAKLCHFIVKGDLYKCFLTSIHEDLTNQFNIDEESKNMLNSTDLCSPYDNNEKIQSFLESLEHHIPQCTLCPEKRINKPLWPLAPVKETL